MEPSEFITRATIWITRLCYFAATAVRLRIHPVNPAIARWLWTVGCIACVIHIFCAFQFHHSWSHQAALNDTARQTAEVTGWDSGVGIWFNYLFVWAWIIDVVRLWGRVKLELAVFHLALAVWQAFFFFMVFNATVVFETGPVRWLGAAGCLYIAALFIRRWPCLASQPEGLSATLAGGKSSPPPDKSIKKNYSPEGSQLDEENP